MFSFFQKEAQTRKQLEIQKQELHEKYEDKRFDYINKANEIRRDYQKKTEEKQRANEAKALADIEAEIMAL